MRIQDNSTGLNAYNIYKRQIESLNKSIAKISSGYKINTAADDAAGLAISEKMRAQIKGMTQASENAAAGKDMLTTAEGGLAQLNDILGRMKTLATEAANGTMSSVSRGNVLDEWKQLLTEMNDTITNTKYNGKSLYSTTAATSITLQTGANSSDTMAINFANLGDTLKALSGGASSGKTDGTIDSTYAETLGKADAAGTGQAAWKALIDTVETQIDTVTAERSKIGAQMNRLDYKISNLGTMTENLTASEGRIRNVDEAYEQLNMTKYQILAQTALSGLAQAIQNPQMVLSLLG